MNLDEFAGVKRKLNLSTVSKPAVVGVAVVLAVVVVVIAGRLLDAANVQDFQVVKGSGQQAHAQTEQVEPSEKTDDDAGQGSLFVHVTGAVNNPGLCELAGEARVFDAIQACGGFADDAASESVNLARLLADGEQLNVATREEYEQHDGGDSQAQAQKQGPLQGASEGATPNALININTADAVELTSLPGIGEATAVKIVSDRQTNGAFKDVRDLTRVSGIGDKKFEALKDLICV